jgi:hypothetical protein
MRVQLGFFLRNEISDLRICELIADALHISPHDVVVLDYGLDQDQAVLVQIVRHERGFLTDVNLSIDSNRVAGAASLTSIDVADRIARLAHTDVAVSPSNDTSPYRWLVIGPTGERRLAEEQEPESGNVIID